MHVRDRFGPRVTLQRVAKDVWVGWGDLSVDDLRESTGQLQLVGAVPTRTAVRGLKLRSALADQNSYLSQKNCHLTDSFGFGSGLIRAGFCVVAWYRSIQ